MFFPSRLVNACSARDTRDGPFGLAPPAIKTAEADRGQDVGQDVLSALIGTVPTGLALLIAALLARVASRLDQEPCIT
jgi:hypothetical protein